MEPTDISIQHLRDDLKKKEDIVIKPKEIFSVQEMERRKKQALEIREEKIQRQNYDKIIKEREYQRLTIIMQSYKSQLLTELEVLKLEMENEDQEFQQIFFRPQADRNHFSGPNPNWKPYPQWFIDNLESLRQNLCFYKYCLHPMMCDSVTVCFCAWLFIIPLICQCFTRKCLMQDKCRNKLIQIYEKYYNIFQEELRNSLT